MSTEPSITLLAGPTASGKSALALKMARERGAAIINADSQQLYSDLRILTARPSLEEEGQAEHRLYGVADAAEAWSVGRWARAVMPLLDDLSRQGRPTILVGGTGLYFTSLTRGLADIPQVPNDVRNAVEEDFAVHGEGAFRQTLAQADLAAARAIEAGDRQRLVRAMSVLVATGKSLSRWKAETRPLLAPDRWRGLVIVPDRPSLYAACDRRVDWMMAEGALDEVRALMARDLDPDLPAMKAVGVRELMSCLKGRTGLDQAVDAVKQSTRNYAKRQLTWFRNQTADWPRVEPI